MGRREEKKGKGIGRDEESNGIAERENWMEKEGRKGKKRKWKERWKE